MREYFAGTRRDFDIALNTHGSEFQLAAWRALCEIPYGETRSYADMARRVGSAGAVRAIGRVNGQNRIAIVIPCHRVIRSDGAFGQYSMGGPEVKREILSAEGLDPEWLDELAATGTRFIGCRIKHVFCLPTCRHIRRVRQVNRVPLRSVRDAVAAGFRPCTRCRPAVVAS
jgi:O-6-methylguanine DNA methyltransferase